MSLFDLSGKVCVVTGSTKGMGRAIVERYTEHGARVVVTSRHLNECEAVAEKLNAKRKADCAVPCAFDLSDAATTSAPIEAALKKWGRIDVVVANAAIITMGAFDAAPDSEYELAFTGNVRNNARLTRAALPAMRKQGNGGSIIYVLSTVGLFPSPPYLTYALSKAALGHLTRILAVDLGPENIRVNAIVPGMIKTFAAEAFSRNPEAVKLAIGRNPLGRMGESDEIAAPAVLLASPGGAYINGQLIIVDGGQIHQGREAARNVAEAGLAEV